MTVLVLIRHAESQMNAEFPHLIGGRTNHSPLSPRGIEQAHVLGQRFKKQNFNPDIWIASPAVRTMHTTQIVLEELDIKPDLLVDEDIQEVHQGNWEGFDRIDTYHAGVLAEMEQKSWHFKAPNGESQYEVEQRMVGFATKCRELFPGKTIAVFSHGVAIKCLMRHVQDWNPKKTYYTEIDNTGISVIGWHDKTSAWQLRTLNDHAHLLTT
jgi:probable phosphoglycerate mutase